MDLKEVLKAKIKKLDENKAITPEDSLKIEDEHFQSLLLKWGKSQSVINGIPKFFNRIPNESEPLRQKLMEESRSNLFKRKSLPLLDRNELNDLWVLLDQHQSSPDEQLITYTDFQKVAQLAGPKVKPYFKSSIFTKLQQGDPQGRVSIISLFNYVMRNVWLDQTRVGLSVYDATGQGYLTETELENYITELLPTLCQLDGLEKSFHSFYVCTAVRKFLFFLDVVRANRVRILDILACSFLDDLLELRDEELSKDLQEQNWFSAPSALRIYGHYLNLDRDHNGMLSKSELAGYGSGTLTQPFLDRVFQTCLTYGGEMDYKTYLDLVLALENRAEPQALAFLFRILDIKGCGYLDAFTLNYFFRAIQDQMKAHGSEQPVPFQDVKDELFDMVRPKDPEKITLGDLITCGQGDTFIVGVQQYPVRPVGIPSQNGVGDANGNVLLGEQLQAESTLTDELVRTAGRRLEDALAEFDAYCASLHLDPHNHGFRMVTDGQLPIRQCLHPEAWRKEFELPDYYNSFQDLRKEVAAFLGREEIPTSVAEMLDLLQIKPECENEFYKKEAKDMVNIAQRLIMEGHRFELLETVNLMLEPGILSKDDEIDPNCVVRARGLPWQSSDQDIAKFFRGVNVAKGGVALCLSNLGRRNGEALVRFVSQEHRDIALKRHKHHIGQRYIEVYRATGDDFLSVAGGSSCEALAFLSRGAAVIVRMRGLPYDCTAQQVLDFFASGEQPCIVMDGAEGVLFVRKPDGRATGDAFVLFPDESDAPKALAKHREVIGSRYIELFRSTTAEVQQVLNRSMMDPPPAPQLPQIPLTNYPLLPQHVITSGTRKDCIRLRGLPYESQVEHILDFLGDFAKNIVYQGVHMVYNAQGQPSGEAFIQMDSEQSAFITAQQKHHRYMIFGKKQRYIEVFQCSGEDMNLVLTGGLPAPTSPAKATAPAPALLSTGGTMLPPPTGLKFPPAGFAPIPFATAPLPPGQYLHAPIFYWPLYPSPPVSPTGYYMQGPPGPPLGPPPHQGQGQGIQQQPQLIQPECLGLPPPISTAALQNLPPIDARLLDASPRPISC